ncbi:hypothetical protein [Streptomyces nigrescens]|uniref:hypothetical protein n=1 Tax=Streptomyces nigrescens TaxID=1920 RepID=UPI00348D68BA
MSDGASGEAEAHDQARIYQAARDLHITHQHGDDRAPRTAPRLSLRHLLSCFDEAPLPLSVLSAEAFAAVRIPELPAERVAAEVRELADRAGVAGEPPLPCVRADAAAVAESARELTDEVRAQLCGFAAALLDHALLRSPDGAAPDLFAPHAMALLWRAGREPSRAATVARRVRDAYAAAGRYEEGLPFAVRIVESSGAGAELADALALGRLQVGCGDFGDAEAVLRPVLDRAEREAGGRGLSLAGHTGPSIAEILRENTDGPFTGRLSPADCHVLTQIAEVQHALADALYGLRRYAECERLLHAAAGLRWRVQGAAHPARLLAQLHRARALGQQRLWHEAFALVHDALTYRDRAELEGDRPRDAALLRLVHAEVTAAAVRSLRDEGASRSRGVGMFPAPVVRFLDRTMSPHTRPEKVTWADAVQLAGEAVRACDRAFGAAHPHARTARTLLEQASREQGSAP